MPDKEEVLGRFYTLDLEKEGAIFILERLQKRQETDPEPGSTEGDEEANKLVRRDDYAEMVQVLRDSLEREVVVEGVLDESDSDLDSSDDEDSNSDSNSEVEE